MQSFQYLRLENSSGLATIVLDRPETLNAINDAVLDELDQAFTMLERDDQTRVVMITGGGDKAFVAGGDIAAMRQMSVLEGEKFVYRGQEVLKKIEDSRKVVIAALNGYTLGGGLELALACDIRIASEKAKLGCRKYASAFIPDGAAPSGW